MEKQEVKDYLKTQYEYHGFIENTLVAEMCINFHEMMIKKSAKNFSKCTSEVSHSIDFNGKCFDCGKQVVKK